jgi:hypothetical protein
MSEQKELQASIEKLNKTETKLASIRWNFARGIVYGFGFFIGGTLLVAILYYLAAQVTDKF